MNSTTDVSSNYVRRCDLRSRRSVAVEAETPKLFQSIGLKRTSSMQHDDDHVERLWLKAKHRQTPRTCVGPADSSTNCFRLLCVLARASLYRCITDAA